MDKIYGALENQLIKEEFNLIFFLVNISQEKMRNGAVNLYIVVCTRLNLDHFYKLVI